MHSAASRLSKLKVFAVLAIMIVLVYFGLRGRQEARTQIRVQEIALVRARIQNQLAEDRVPSIIAGGIAPHIGLTMSSSNQVKDLTANLKVRLEQFEIDYGRHEMTKSDSLEVRLAKAVLANMEHRFSDALTIVTDEDEKPTRASSNIQTDRSMEVLQTRGDSFYSLGEWQKAQERYNQILSRKTGQIAALISLANTQLALGNITNALASYAELATHHNRRGNALLIQGKTEAAFRDYNQAVDLQKILVEKHGRGDLLDDLAISFRRRGNAYLAQRKMDAALVDMGSSIEALSQLLSKEQRSETAEQLAITYQDRGNAHLFQGKLDSTISDLNNAINILAQLIEKLDRVELSKQLAMARQNRGNAFLAQGKLDAALVEFDNTVEILNRLINQRPENELIHDLARTHNNRGVLNRAKGKLDLALKDFELAIQLITEAIEKEERNSTVSTLSSGSKNEEQKRQIEAKLEVSMGYSDNAFDALLRTRFFEQRLYRELHVTLAISGRNRGYAYLAQGKPELAIKDFRKAVDIFARLVDQEGERDLALQFTKSLGTIAWLHATNPSDAIRNGRSALEYAIKACEQSEWRLYGPVETLAAAYAETANFSEAIKWQEKALQLAPAKNKTEVRSRLELYKSGKPYRAPVS